MESVEQLQAELAEVMAQVNALIDRGDKLVARITEMQAPAPSRAQRRSSAKAIKAELRKRGAAARASGRGFFRA